MSLTLAEQLSALPLPLLTTVLRVEFDLYETPTVFEQAASILETWANVKCKPSGVVIPVDTNEFSFSADSLGVEFARTDDAWALCLEHPDSSSRAGGRSWVCEIALERRIGVTRFSTRLSYRQPINGPVPAPRAPKYIADLVRNVGAVDHQILEGRPQPIGAGDVSTLIDLLESKSRRLPIIAISNDEESGGPFCSPERLADFHCGTAHVLQLDVRATWGLTTLWDEKWSTYRGAVRCYAPGLDHRSSNPFQHRLWLPTSIRRADAFNADGFLNLCLRHVFATVTAQFESIPLLSPAAIKRRVAELSAVQKPTAPTEEARDREPTLQVLHEAIWIDAIPVTPIAADGAIGIESLAAAEKRHIEQVDALAIQVKSLEGQLQEARNQSAQEGVKYEALEPVINFA